MKISDQIELNIVLKQLLSNVANDVCLAYLARAVDQHNRTRVRFQVIFYLRFNLSE